MKKIVVILMFSAMSVVALAQNSCPNFEWTKQAGGNSNNFGYSIAVDNSGNTYIIGMFRGTAIFGDITLISEGSDDIFIAKIDDNGNFLWAEKAGGNGYDSGYSISVDNSGNSYITGRFQGTATFGNTTLISSGDYDVFIAKIDNDGNFLWAKQTGGNNGDSGYGITADNSGNTYITGVFSGEAIFGNITLTGAGGYDVFIAKIDDNGNFLWAKQAGGSLSDIAESISVDNNGNSYITGRFQGTATFGDTTLTSSGGYDVFIAKIDNNGNFLWAKQAGGSSDDYVTGIAVDISGNSYITGGFSEEATFGNITLAGVGGHDVFIAKIDDSGNFLWAKQAGGNSDDSGYSIAVDNSGNSYITGAFSGIATFGNTLFTSRGSNDVFIAKLDNNGSFLWVKQAGASYYDSGSGITIDNSGNIYMIEFFINFAMFDNNTLTSAGSGYDIFITKISENILSLDSISNVTINCGESATISVNSQNYRSVQWSPATGVSNPNEINPTFSPLGTTKYTLTVTDDCGNTESQNVTINVVSPFEVSAQAINSAIDCGASTQLSADLDENIPNASYQWSPTTGLDNPNIANPTASPGLTTTYTVTVTSPQGCFSTDSITINVNNPNPSVVNIQSNTGDFYLCDNGLTLSAPGFASYQWSNGSTSPNITVNQPGDYSVTVYEASGCAGQAFVTVAPLAEITAPHGSVLCPEQPGQKVKLEATAGMDSYYWSNGAETQSIQVSSPGTYTCTVTKNGCSYTVSILVKSIDQASVDFNYQLSGMSVQFNVISPSINLLYWDFGDGNISFDINPVHTYSSTGLYDVLLTIADVCGNTAYKLNAVDVTGEVGLEGEKLNSFKIYPNPTNDKVFIESESMISNINLMDLNSRIILHQEINNAKAQLDLSRISKGIYLVKIMENDGKTTTLKVVKN